jgi:hypothetical protein
MKTETDASRKMFVMLSFFKKLPSSLLSERAASSPPSVASGAHQKLQFLREG